MPSGLPFTDITSAPTPAVAAGAARSSRGCKCTSVGRDAAVKTKSSFSPTNRLTSGGCERWWFGGLRAHDFRYSNMYFVVRSCYLLQTSLPGLLEP